MFNSYDKFTHNFKKVIQKSAWLCLNEFKKVITPLHLFLGILSVPESLAYEILKSFGLTDTSKTNLLINHTSLKFTHIQAHIDYNEVFSLSMDQESIRILERAADIAIAYNHMYVGTEHLLASMVELQTPVFMEELRKANISRQQLLNKLEEILQSKMSKLKPALTHRNGRKQQIKQEMGKIEAPQKRIDKVMRREELLPTPALDHFTIDLMKENMQAMSHPLIGRHDEIERLINILSRKNKNNPLLLGEPGVGKTAIVEGLAKLIYSGKAPDTLAHKRILALDLNAVVAGTIYRGEFESRLKQIIEELKMQDDIILFIDEIHNLVGAGSASGSMDAANILKPYLARGEISCIGATTLAEFKAHFENDAALERRFQPIIVEEPTKEETLQIVKGIKGKLEEYHRVYISDDALEAAVDLSERFLPQKFFPDKAIDLLDEAASHTKVEKSKDVFGKQIRLLKEELRKILAQKDIAVREENFVSATELKNKEESLVLALHELKTKQKEQQKEIVGAINRKHIVELITDIVKIPFLEMANINKAKLLNLETILGNRVLGQEKVLREIAKTLRRGEAGLADPKRPLASFLFLGPSGVGKTETAKVIAEEVFGDPKALIRINMSEFQESFNATKLIGAPAGYVGYKDSNQLGDKVRARPYSVVLFDEMEKAHPDIFNLLLQILEDGYLMDSLGKHINFKNTIIIFTSNIGLQRFNEAQSLGFTANTKKSQIIKMQFDEIKRNIMDELYATYKVEFLNRIDKILFFEPLTQEVVGKIVELTIIELNKKLQDKEIKVELSPRAKDVLARLSFSPDDGARSVRRVIQEQIEEVLVEKMLNYLIKSGGTVKVGVKGKKITLHA